MKRLVFRKVGSPYRPHNVVLRCDGRLLAEVGPFGVRGKWATAPDVAGHQWRWVAFDEQHDVIADSLWPEFGRVSYPSLEAAKVACKAYVVARLAEAKNDEG